MAALGSLSFSSLASSSSSSPKPSSFLATATLRPRFFLCTPFAAKMSAASASCSSVSGNAAASAVASVGQDLPDDYEEWTPKPDPRDRRRAGVLLHPTSFRGPYGIGDFGAEAFRFIDWLHQAGCSVWQKLCRFYLLFLREGRPMKRDRPTRASDAERVNFAAVADLKDPLIAKAAERLIQSDGELKSQLENFHKDPSISSWLEDAAYFAAIDDSLNTFSWYLWPESLKNRHLAALEEIYQSKKDFIDLFIAQQFLFQRQWQKVRNYAQMKGISIMGDMPIYVGYHSADVWANKKHFLLNRRGFPLEVSGVPPDAFSETGQLWGSPLYDWKAMEKDGFSWWIHRIRRARDLYDEFRIDHFRGFAGFWAVPSEAKVAMDGRWKVGPGKSLFDAIFRSVGNINIIAEDLGVITEDVVQLRKSIGAPGMAVLQFGFGSDSKNPHLPHNHERNQVVYTGTHDNDTVKILYYAVMKYLSISEEDDISWKLIQAALSSVAQTAVIPLQDILRLGVSARMNIPATQFGNWSWRIPSSTSFDRLETEATKLRDLLSTYGRL
ncbi:4-alpha-glucanotransferase DPE1 /amyloplastic [Citrus sinensis]|uniref:4-alpha-glucanotransferase DPE1 /amyloplastic n=1 Tax=Citrus sinensis TaxID=2711 RepID=A0ACB8JLA9_CITSI|nr:4-alpha-glucanotransferase DPE1 /amyloplastic [Citrus sinensis]